VSLALPYFSTLSHKPQDFRKKDSLNIKCVFLFSLQHLSLTFIILRRIQQYFITSIIGLHVKYPLFLSDFNKTLIFSADLKKKIQISTFLKIHPVGAELLLADGQTLRS
jgi:hypothetical protein